MDMRLKALESKTQVLEAKLDDQKGRSRRNNILIIGVPECIEGTSMVNYLDDWLQTTVAPEGLSKFFAVERAHRVLVRPPRACGPPRPVVAKLLHYWDYILQQAKKKVQFAVENSVLSIYPDFMLEIQMQRMAFTQVKKRLRELSIKYSMT